MHPYTQVGRLRPPPALHTRARAPLQDGLDGAARTDDRCLYRLVGVLVHTGTCNSGHYYSFVKERVGERWLQFNDEVVDVWDADAMLKEACFGGADGGDILLSKPYSAYMLVYERTEPGSAPAPAGAPAESAAAAAHQPPPVQPPSQAAVEAASSAAGPVAAPAAQQGQQASGVGMQIEPETQKAEGASAKRRTSVDSDEAEPAEKRARGAFGAGADSVRAVAGSLPVEQLPLATDRAMALQLLPPSQFAVVMAENRAFLRDLHIHDPPYFRFAWRLLRGLAPDGSPAPECVAPHPHSLRGGASR
jgi:hypothetical protein